MTRIRLARTTTGLIGVLAALAAALSVTGTAQAAARASMTPETDTEVPYLVENVIHAEGQEVPLPADMLDPESYYTLLGESPRGWVVERTTPIPDDVLNHYDMFLVTASGDTPLFTFHADWGWPDFYLSTKGTRILSANRYEECTDLVVYDLDGKAVSGGEADRDFRLLDFDGSRVLFSTDRTTRLWRIGPDTKEQLAKAPAQFGSLHTRTLMLQRHHSRSRLSWTGFARPGATRWQASVQPISLNPSGKRLVAFGPSGLQVRRVSDGKIIRRFHPGGLVGAASPGSPANQVWENDHAILALADGTPGSFILRCDVDHGCAMASPVFDGRPSLAQVWPRT